VFVWRMKNTDFFHILKIYLNKGIVETQTLKTATF